MPEPIYTKDGRLGRGQLTCLNLTYLHTKTNKNKKNKNKKLIKKIKKIKKNKKP